MASEIDETITDSPVQKMERMSLEEMYSKADETQEIVIEYENNKSIKLILRKGIPWDASSKAESAAMTVNIKGEGEIDPYVYMMELWDHVVVKSEPRIKISNLKLMEADFARDLLTEVFNRWNRVKINVTKIRKN